MILVKPPSYQIFLRRRSSSCSRQNLVHKDTVLGHQISDAFLLGVIPNVVLFNHFATAVKGFYFLETIAKEHLAHIEKYIE